MITNNGQRCQRNAQEGGLGFCWQHLPIKASEKSKLRERLEVVGTGVLINLAVKVLEQVVTLATEALNDVFGVGDPSENNARAELEHRYKIIRYPELPSSYMPGTRVVGWNKLLTLVRNTDSLSVMQEPAVEEIRNIDRRFETWFKTLDPYHQDLLLNSIREFNENQ